MADILTKSAVLALAGFILAACGSDDNLAGTRYDVDIQSGLCYATNGVKGEDGYTISNVPCTLRVINLAPKEKRTFAVPVSNTLPVPPYSP